MTVQKYLETLENKIKMFGRGSVKFPVMEPIRFRKERIPLALNDWEDTMNPQLLPKLTGIIVHIIVQNFRNFRSR